MNVAERIQKIFSQEIELAESWKQIGLCEQLKRIQKQVKAAVAEAQKELNLLDEGLKSVESLDLQSVLELLKEQKQEKKKLEGRLRAVQQLYERIGTWKVNIPQVGENYGLGYLDALGRVRKELKGLLAEKEILSNKITKSSKAEGGDKHK
jgi:hypothetical protein